MDQSVFLKNYEQMISYMIARWTILIWRQRVFFSDWMDELMASLSGVKTKVALCLFKIKY